MVCTIATWSAIRPILTTLTASWIHFIDVAIVSGTGIILVALGTRWISRPLVSYVGPTQSNAVKILFQLVGLSTILFLLFAVTGFNILSTLVGVGFFGIVVGLAAQSVLGNLISGMMLLASRPFHINDRIALITWQYGKFPPTLSHGWLEPAYTGVVQGITLTYTRVQTDSDAMLKIPNAIVTQSLILNLSHSKQGFVASQFETPIQVDPDDLRKNISSILSKDKEFAGEESFEVLEISPINYLISVSYRADKSHQREMKTRLNRAIRLSLLNYQK